MIGDVVSPSRRALDRLSRARYRADGARSSSEGFKPRRFLLEKGAVE